MAAATVFTNSGRFTAATRMLTALGRSPLLYVGMGTGGGARTAAVTDTALTTPVETPRTAGAESVVTTTVASDTYQVVATITATAARVVNEAGTFDAASAGNMGVSATFLDINLATGDSIQFTIKSVFA